MINTKDKQKYPTIQVRSQELRNCAIDFAEKYGLSSMNEAVYKILKAFFEMEGYTGIPDFNGIGGFNVELTPETYERLKEQALHMRTIINKREKETKRVVYPQGRYLLEKYNERMQYQSDDIQVKRLTIEDVAQKLGTTKEAIKRCFWIMPVAYEKLDADMVKKVCQFFKVPESELLKEAE